MASLLRRFRGLVMLGDASCFLCMKQLVVQCSRQRRPHVESFRATRSHHEVNFQCQARPSEWRKCSECSDQDDTSVRSWKCLSLGLTGSVCTLEIGWYGNTCDSPGRREVLDKTWQWQCPRSPHPSWNWLHIRVHHRVCSPNPATSRQ